MATNSVAYGVCPAGPADFKTGSPTVSIASGVATFSVAQTNALMGPGAEISYNDGSAKKCYIKPTLGSTSPKISQTQWRVTTATGTAPADCTNASVSAITHPYASISAAEAGYTDADHINNASQVTADVDVYFYSYCEQSTYTADTTAVSLSGPTTDATHQLYITTADSTEANADFTPGTVWSETKPRLSVTSAGSADAISSAGASTLRNVVTMRMQFKADVAQNCAGIKMIATSGVYNIRRCLVWIVEKNTTSYYHAGILANNTGTIVSNCVCFVTGTPGSNASSGGLLTTAGNVVFNSCTLYGFYRGFNRQTAGSPVVSNCAFIGSAAASTWTSTTHNYNVYDIDASEANGFLTTQADNELFAAASGNVETWNWAPLNETSNLVGKGTDLTATYDGDLQHANGTGWRPKRGTWDCGAIEYQTPCNITSITAVGTTVTVTGTGFKPNGSTNPTGTDNGAAISWTSATDTQLVCTAAGYGLRTIALTTSDASSDSDTVTVAAPTSGGGNVSDDVPTGYRNSSYRRGPYRNSGYR